LAATGLDVTGVDISQELLALAQHHARRLNLPVTWVESDIALMAFDRAFDAVAQFCSNFLTWFSDPAETLDVLWNVTGLLRPGGRLLVGTEDWLPELPPRAQDWDEWRGGAAIYRHHYDADQRIAHTQTVVFGPEHERHEYNRQTWWPSRQDMEALFARVGLTVCGRYNALVDLPYNPALPGLVYVLVREGK
jgi:hypothetical protein